MEMPTKPAGPRLFDRYCPVCSLADTGPDSVCGACRALLWTTLRTGSTRRWPGLIRDELRSLQWDVPEGFVWLSLWKLGRKQLPQWREHVVWRADNGLVFRVEHDSAATIDGQIMPLPPRPWHVARGPLPGWREVFVDFEIIALIPAQFGAR